MDATLPNRRRFNGSLGATTPGSKSVGSLGSLPASPAASGASLLRAPLSQHTAAYQRQIQLEATPSSGSAGAGQQRHARKSSQTEAVPAVSHFSIAAVLKPRGPAGAAAKQQVAAGGNPAQPAAATGRQQQSQQQQQQQLVPGQLLRQVSIDVDATLQAQQRSSDEACTSGRHGPGGSPWTQLPAVHGRLASLSLRDCGVASVPLEVASPMRGSASSRGSSIRGSDSSGTLAGVAATMLGAQPPESRGPASAQASASAQRSSSQEQVAGQLTADEHHARGYSLRKRGDFAGAVREYTAALAQCPRHFKSLFNRAFSLDKVGRHAAVGSVQEGVLLRSPWCPLHLGSSFSWASPH